MIGQAGLPYPFNYTALDGNNGLFVQAKVYDVTGGFPGTLAATINMVLTTVGSYDGIFTGAINKVYKIAMTVYTDGTYTTVDPDYAPQSEMVQMLDIAAQPAVSVLSAQFLNPPVLQARILGEC